MQVMEVINEVDFFRDVGKWNLLLVEEKDRSHLIKRIKELNLGECFFFGEEEGFSSLMNEVMQPSLFGGQKVMVVLDCEKFSDEQWEEILKQEDCCGFFFKKSSTKSLEELFKGRGKILRLTAEKPWDRKNRLVKEVIESAFKDGVIISQPTAYRFVERAGNDLQLFHGELKKLRAFARGKSKLEDSDIDAIIRPLPEENLFKVSEELVWKGVRTPNFYLDGVSSLLQIIGAFRFQAYLGLKMVSHEDLKLPPWQEKKYRHKSKALGSDFFKKLLLLVYKAEQRSKQTSMNASAIFDILTLEVMALFSKSSGVFLKR